MLGRTRGSHAEKNATGTPEHRRSGEEGVLDLVSAVYDAALDASLWPAVLNGIGDTIGGPQLLFGVFDPATGLSNMLAPRGDALRVEAGALSAAYADDGRALRALIASCTNAGHLTAGGELRTRRATGGLPLELLVTPAWSNGADVVPSMVGGRAAAVVLISDLEGDVRARIEALRERFGLTPAEAAFAIEITKGDGRQAAAERLGITVGTARSHLSNIFDKTGARRQAELVRLLAIK